MVKKQLRERIISHLGESSIQIFNRKEYLVFDNTEGLSWRVLPNFNLGELLTKNRKDTYTKLDLDLLVELQSLRNIWGSGIGISSSYRSPTYNRSVNGEISSEHINGNALDMYPVNGDILGFKNIIRFNKKSGGRGYYKTFVHIDTGRTRVW